MPLDICDVLETPKTKRKDADGSSLAGCFRINIMAPKRVIGKPLRKLVRPPRPSRLARPAPAPPAPPFGRSFRAATAAAQILDAGDKDSKDDWLDSIALCSLSALPEELLSVALPEDTESEEELEPVFEDLYDALGRARGDPDFGKPAAAAEEAEADFAVPFDQIGRPRGDPDFGKPVRRVVRFFEALKDSLALKAVG
eukprot:SAG11_NODE_7013_length_1208_cov_1.520289_2_plen_198_part_00